MESETKQCPHCGKEIKAVAKKCRYCGEWLDDNQKPQPEQSPDILSENIVHNTETPDCPDSEVGISKLNTNKIAGIIVASLVVIGILCFLVIKSNSNNDYNYNSDDYYYSDTIVAEETQYEYVYDSAADAASVLTDDNSGVCPTDGEPDEEDYKASVASMRYYNKKAEVSSADIHLMRADGRKIWYNPWEEATGYSNKLYVYDSETDKTTVIRLNKTSMSDNEMHVDDMVENNGIITIIMSEIRNSNGWIEGTYVWQYNCDTGSWKCLAKECSGAEFTNNRKAVKVGYAKSKNPDDPIYMQEYQYSYKNLKL